MRRLLSSIENVRKNYNMNLYGNQSHSMMHARPQHYYQALCAAAQALHFLCLNTSLLLSWYVYMLIIVQSMKPIFNPTLALTFWLHYLPSVQNLLSIMVEYVPVIIIIRHLPSKHPCAGSVHLVQLFSCDKSDNNNLMLSF